MSSALVLPPSMVVSAPSGSSRLPIVELSRADVVAPRKQIRIRTGSKKRAATDCSFGPFQDHLTVDAWPLFHAAKKTELTTTFNAADVSRRALCFASENSGLFDWTTPDLRRVDRSVFALEDFAEAGLAGRFGEAIAYLTMIKWGYAYFDRISVIWSRAARHAGMTHAEQVRNARVLASRVGKTRPDLEPDFVFEKKSGDVALMESKGSFVHPVNDDPSTKNDLRHALDQLAAWSAMITPTPAKSYAIGTYFRDQSDATGDPSLITFVDPPGDRDDEFSPVEVRPDWVRRGNYGSWLHAMGLPESGDALRTGREIALAERRLPVVAIGSRRYAVAIDGAVLKRNRRAPEPLLSFWIDSWMTSRSLRSVPPHFFSDLGVESFRVSGVELTTLKLVEESVVNSASQSLMDQGTRTLASIDERQSKGLTGSVFPDGTLYGLIAPEVLFDASLESFRL